MPSGTILTSVKGIKYLNKRRSKTKSVPCNYKAFENNIKKELEHAPQNLNLIRTTLLHPYIEIQDLSMSQICKWIISEKYRIQLKEAYANNKKEDNNHDKNIAYEFYTVQL